MTASSATSATVWFQGPYPAWFVLSAEDRAGNYGGLVHACDFIVTEEGTILKSRFGGITIGDERNHEYMEKALQVWNLIGGAK